VSAAVAERALDDARLTRALRSLAPLLALDGDLRSSGCEPRVPGETAARQTPTEHAIDAGTLAAARRAHDRLGRCPGCVETLRWLATHGGDLATVDGLAQLVAEERGPVALREALPAASAAVLKARTSLAFAMQRAHVGKRAPTAAWLLTAGADTARARESLASALARETQARASLVAWGRARIERAVTAWEASVRDSSD
jgi:hypothetical protein